MKRSKSERLKAKGWTLNHHPPHRRPTHPCATHSGTLRPSHAPGAPP